MKKSTVMLVYRLITIHQEATDGICIDSRNVSAEGNEGFDLGRKMERALAPRPEQRFLAEGIAAQKEDSSPAIINGECPHALEMVNTGCTVLPVCLN